MDAKQIKPYNYPSYHHAALNAVVDGSDLKRARQLVAWCLRQYRHRGLYATARQFLRHVNWVGYPAKERRTSIKAPDILKASAEAAGRENLGYSKETDHVHQAAPHCNRKDHCSARR